MIGEDVEAMLIGLRQSGMANAFRELSSSISPHDLTFVEMVGRMCMTQREVNRDRSLARLKRAAKFRFEAHPEDIIWDRKRGLDKARIGDLLLPDWIRRMENLMLTGSSGTGKTWLACAFGHALVRQGISVRYVRTNPILESMRIAHLDGTIGRLRKSLAKPDLLILDDFGIAPIQESAKEDLFELIEARTDVGSTLIAGQLSPKEWHNYLASDHLADAIMDRLIQRSHKITLKGDSLRARL